MPTRTISLTLIAGLTLLSTPLLADNSLDEALIAEGKAAYKRCGLCHGKPDSEPKRAPSLSGIVNGPVAGDENYSRYSSALRNFALETPVWTPELLEAFIASPRTLVPGNQMKFSGIKQEEDRKAIVSYLAQY